MARPLALLVAAWLIAGCAAVGSAPASPSAPLAPTPAYPVASPAPASAMASPPTTAEARTVDVGGRSLHIECQGSGSPTVVLEAGLTGDHRTWEGVAPLLAKRVRVCAYDRANVPPSDAAPTPRTVEDVVDDLAALLEASGETTPIVLVGFSFGGLASQMYAAARPDDVAGLVLVESNHPDENDDFWAHLTPAQIKEDRAFMRDNPEGIDLEASFKQAQAAADLPEVPLVVVTAGISEGWPEEWGDPAVFDGIRAGHQLDLATRVPGGVQVIAERSTHHVPSQEPDVVIEAVEKVLDQLQ
ncbi:MAG: alpha/beta fold hydrolase [Chloroflexi bacterium]|nr:alpha/beta fold hydrolase [Chloroflexota bacterium]